MKKLILGPTLSLPLDAQTRTAVVYGGKGKGKTNCGAVLCEELAKAGLRFCVIDPLDVWWGLRYGRTKTTQGLDVVILGGQHGDLPIEPGAGATSADFVADERANTIIVMRRANGEMWSNGERIRFMRDFVRRLFQRQGEARQPLMLVIDEAGRFVPQMAPKGAIDINDCIGAIEELVEWGRNVGIGVMLITQRSARMNKSVSELAECMIAFQTAGPRSIGAIVDWFGEHVAKERQHELIERLRKLPVGTALVVSPEWLNFEGEAEIRLRETFDSSATPKAGARPAKPGKARAIDLERYRTRLQATIEKAKANDPREMAKRIAELEKQVKARVASAPDPEHWAKAKAQLERVHALQLSQIQKRIEALRDQFRKASSVAHDATQRATDAFGAFATALASIKIDSAVAASASDNGVRHAIDSAIAIRQPRIVATRPQIEASQKHSELRSSHARDRAVAIASSKALAVVDALAMLERAGVDLASHDRVAALVGISARKSTWRAHLAILRRKNLIADGAGMTLRLTDAGRSAASEAPTFASLEDLHAHWVRTVGAGAADILRLLIKANGEPLARSYIAETLDLDASKSTWRAHLAKLRAPGLIRDVDAEHLAASDILFPAWLS